MIEQLIEDLAHSLGQWSYLLVAFLAMAETAAFVGFVAPGEFAVILGGVLAGEGELNVWILIGVVWVSVVIGDGIGFLLGHRLGRAFLIKHGARVRLTEERVRKVEDYFARHGGKTVLLGRWVGFVRPLMPFLAGASGMSYRRFLPYDVLGAGTWGTFFTLLGYIFWRSFTRITEIAGKGALAFGITLVVFIGAYQAFKRLRHPEERRRFAAWLERQGRRPALRPVAALCRWVWRIALRPLWRFVLAPAWRVAAPPLRFLAGRVTPGGLGIELTTLLAIAAVSIYVVVLQVDLISSDTTLAGDEGGLERAREMESGLLTAIAKTLSVLGRFGPMALLVGATCVFLLTRRRRVDAVTLAAGFACTQVATHILKDGVERMRPAGGLVDTDTWAYPSGHASLSITFIAIAVVVSRMVPLTRRLAIMLVGLALAVLMGLSRIYLRVHYLSDVVGGWAVGLAAYSICAIVALVVTHVRHNLEGARAAAAQRGESAG